MKIRTMSVAVDRVRPIALGVAIAAALPMAAQAGIIELYTESTYSMGGGSSTTLKDPSSGTRTSGYVDVLAFTTSNSNSIGLHSYGSDVGDFGSRSSGAGIYDVSGLFRIREQLTNSSGSAANALFNFNITPGLLSNEIRSGFGSGEFVTATISFEVLARRNADPFSTVWSSTATLRSDSGGLGTFSSSGSDTGFYVANPFYSGGVYYDVQSFSKSLDLGLLNPSDTLDLTYEIKSSAQGNSSGGGSYEVPGRTVNVPGHWEWTRTSFDTYGGPGQAENGACFGYGEYATAAVFDGYGGYGGDPGTPPTDSPCWVWLGPATQYIEGYTVTSNDPNGSQASSGDPFLLDLNGNIVGYYDGLLPIQGGLRLANVPAPGALSLLGVGLMAGLLLRRRVS